MLSPLRKLDASGHVYTRPKPVDARLSQLLLLKEDALLDQCALTERQHPEYVPSECLVYLLRSKRDQAPDHTFELLYKLLFERIIRSLPPLEIQIGTPLRAERIHDKVLGPLREALARDRGEYFDKLDMFEVRFDFTLKKLRLSAYKHGSTLKNRDKEPICDDETGEVVAKVDEASIRHELCGNSDNFGEDYRIRLDEAIESLPREQRITMHMLLDRSPIHSIDPEVLTITKVLDCSEKTVWNYRTRAVTTLRELLGEESK